MNRMPTVSGAVYLNLVTRFVTRTAVLNVVKQSVPDAYISGNQIILPTLPSGHQEGDRYALRVFTTTSYTEGV